MSGLLRKEVLSSRLQARRHMILREVPAHQARSQSQLLVVLLTRKEVAEPVVVVKRAQVAAMAEKSSGER